ncbi:MAG: hypothetical protein MZV64_17525 [Ignavibacteriales bacterium]|nr:hypothetical protein [Ignavibacteriales bacterium]
MSKGRMVSPVCMMASASLRHHRTKKAEAANCGNSHGGCGTERQCHSHHEYRRKHRICKSQIRGGVPAIPCLRNASGNPAHLQTRANMALQVLSGSVADESKARRGLERSRDPQPPQGQRHALLGGFHHRGFSTRAISWSTSSPSRKISLPAKPLEEAERSHRRLAEALRDTSAALNSTLKLDRGPGPRAGKHRKSDDFRCRHGIDGRRTYGSENPPAQ